jgi:hypothetical protein
MGENDPSIHVLTLGLGESGRWALARVGGASPRVDLERPARVVCGGLKASGSEAAVWLMPLLELEWSRHRRRASDWSPNELIFNYSSDWKNYPPGYRMLRLRM